MNDAPPPPRVLSIAGSDSCGGAGIQADIKAITMLGGYAMTAITAVTAQNTHGVQAVEALGSAFVLDQVESCLSDIGADAIKIGMLGSPETARMLARRLDTFAGPIVFDPVMVATSGSVLADEDTIAAFASLMEIATIVTPNLPELQVLAGRSTIADDEIFDAARQLSEKHGVQVLAKGGHAGDTDQVVDHLSVGHFGQRSFGVECVSMFAGDLEISPLDLQEHILLRDKRVVPPQTDFPPSTDSAQVGVAGVQPDVIEVDAANGGNGLVVDQATAVGFEQSAERGHVGVGRDELDFLTRFQVLAWPVPFGQLKRRLPGFVPRLLFGGHRSVHLYNVDSRLT